MRFLQTTLIGFVAAVVGASMAPAPEASAIW